MKKNKLYILIFRDNEAIKIGQANDISNQLISLKKWWGEPDYKESYSLEIDLDDVFKIETSLQLILSSYSLNYSTGDGRNEIFSLQALDYAVKHIELYIEHSYNQGKLKKGIEELIQTQSVNNIKRDYLTTRYVSKQKNLIVTIDSLSVKLKKIMRFVSILIKYRHRIRYQSSVDENRIKLLISNDILSKSIDYNSIFNTFRLEGKDFNGELGSYNFLSRINRSEEGLQFIFFINDVDENENLLVRYFSEQMGKILLTIPKRSPALANNVSLSNRV